MLIQRCINVVQRWRTDVGSCFILNVGSTLFQRWSTALKQRWSNLGMLAEWRDAPFPHWDLAEAIQAARPTSPIFEFNQVHKRRDFSRSQKKLSAPSRHHPPADNWSTPNHENIMRGSVSPPIVFLTEGSLYQHWKASHIRPSQETITDSCNRTLEC